jgi:hypothetical protein
VPFDTYHLNDQPGEVRAAHDEPAPVVLADTDDGLIVLLGRRELSACGGSVRRLVETIDTAAAARSLGWPT